MATKNKEDSEFMIDPYKLNLFDNKNNVITHYENIINNFNYNKFNLDFSLEFKSIKFPKIYDLENYNILSNNTDRYNIYPTNWISGPKTFEGQILDDKTIDPNYENISDIHILSSQEDNLAKNKIIGKSIKNINKNDPKVLWNIIYNGKDSYKIISTSTGKSLLNNIANNSELVLIDTENPDPNYKKFTISDTNTDEIYLEKVSTKIDTYYISFKTVDGKKLYLSTSNWDGILIGRDFGEDEIFKKNEYIIKPNSIDNRDINKIKKAQEELGLSDDEINEIMSNIIVLTTEKLLQKEKEYKTIEQKKS